jgi:N-acetylmuramoyl-L-alanine amidase-like protein
LRAERLAQPGVPAGRAATRVGELAVGTPYVAFTLEEYLKAGGSPSATEPLTLSLTRFDCVSLVESCLAVARVADDGGTPTWERFGHEMERMRYRGGERRDYASRLHYFSEWISDGTRRGLLRDLGAELGGVNDARPLRFMTEHRSSYPGLADDMVFRTIGEMERSLDDRPRRVVPTDRIRDVSDRIETGDVLAFATAIPGLDVTHAAFAYRDAHGVLRVLHAPLSGGAVEVTDATLPQYVAAIRRSTGILVARPLRA